MSIRSTIREGWAARHEPEAAGRMARGYWAFLLVFFALALAFDIAYGVWEFSRPLLGNASSAVVGSPRSPLERADIQHVLDGFDKRVQLFEERQNAPPLSDPS